MTTTLTPSTMTVTNNLVTCTFTSSGGGLADPSASTLLQLVKSGSGLLIMDNYTPNAYSGGTVINPGGTIQVGNNNDNAGDLGAGPVVNNGRLVFESGASVIANAISGSGAILQSNSQSLTLSGANGGFTGTITVPFGVLYAGSATAFGASTGITIDSGAILDLDGLSAGAAPVFAQGAGSIPLGGNQGAIDNSKHSTIPANDIGVEFLTLTGNTTLSTSGARWDLRSPGADSGVVGSSPATSTAALSTGGQPYNLTVLGTKFLGIVSAWVDPALANIDVVGGTFDYEGNTSGLGNPTNTVTVETGAMLELWNASNALNKVIVLTNGAYLLNSGSGIPSNNIIGPLILTNDPSNPTTPSVCQFVLASNTTLNLQGPVTGQASLTWLPPSAGSMAKAQSPASAR